MYEVLGIVLFLIGFFTGLKLGYKVSKGQMPRNPVQVVKAAVENKKIAEKEKEEADEWGRLMNFDGFTDEEKAQMRNENE